MKNVIEVLESKATLKLQKLTLKALDQQNAGELIPMGKVIIYNLPPVNRKDVSKTVEEIKVMAKAFFNKVGNTFLNKFGTPYSDLLWINAIETELTTLDLLKVLKRLDQKGYITLGEINAKTDFSFTKVGAYICKKQIIKKALKKALKNSKN